MTFPLTKMLTSSRTKPNGQINKEYEDLPEYVMDRQFKDPVAAPYSPPYVLDMDKEALIIYAKDMFKLTLHRKMSAGNMVREIYECINNDDYIPPNERIRKTPTKPSLGNRQVGRPKGSKNKKAEPLIEKL